MIVTSSSCAVWLIISTLVLASCGNNEKKSVAPVDEETGKDRSSSNNQALTNNKTNEKQSPRSIDPLADDTVGKINKTTGSIRLIADFSGEDGDITLAKAEIIKDGQVDTKATGQITFKLASVDEDELTFLDMTARACAEDENEDEDNDCGDLDCYDDDDCPLEKQLVNGVAILFNEQTPYPIGEAISTGDEIELQAVYDTSPPKNVTGRFELTLSDEE